MNRPFLLKRRGRYWYYRRDDEKTSTQPATLAETMLKIISSEFSTSPKCFLQVDIHTANQIRVIPDIIRRGRLNLATDPGIYAFWWIGSKGTLLSSNRRIRHNGPKTVFVDVEFNDWWPLDLHFPCLYVGRTTNIKNRFSQHLKRGCHGRLHTIPKSNQKQQPATTSCQLRYGIEHIFKSEPNPLKIIEENVGFSYQTSGIAADAAERFYTEDLLIGLWRPWFNVDSER
ncbi:MAG TPA: GIY-YIG nuclease family protein [bacterium]|nr:GIY-YIG nuclease family protein [bacterium]